MNDGMEAPPAMSPSDVYRDFFKAVSLGNLIEARFLCGKMWSFYQEGREYLFETWSYMWSTLNDLRGN